MKRLIAIAVLMLAALTPVASAPVDALSYCGSGHNGSMGWAGCDSNAGSQQYVRVLLKCRHTYYSYVTTSHYGPWKFGANNDSIAYCPSGYRSYAAYYQLA